jgi:hypothetical protein
MAISFNGLKAERKIKRFSCFHGFDGIQAHLLIPFFTGLADHCTRQRPADKRPQVSIPLSVTISTFWDPSSLTDSVNFPVAPTPYSILVGSTKLKLFNKLIPGISLLAFQSDY